MSEVIKLANMEFEWIPEGNHYRSEINGQTRVIHTDNNQGKKIMSKHETKPINGWYVLKQFLQDDREYIFVDGSYYEKDDIKNIVGFCNEIKVYKDDCGNHGEPLFFQTDKGYWLISRMEVQ